MLFARLQYMLKYILPRNIIKEYMIDVEDEHYFFRGGELIGLKETY